MFVTSSRHSYFLLPEGIFFSANIQLYQRISYFITILFNYPYIPYLTLPYPALTPLSSTDLNVIIFFHRILRKWGKNCRYHGILIFPIKLRSEEHAKLEFYHRNVWKFKMADVYSLTSEENKLGTSTDRNT